MEEYLQGIKNRLHILHSRDDENLLSLLEQGYNVIQSYCGSFELGDHQRGLGLVFEWVRFAYNGQTEYFYNCFKEDLNMFGFQLLSNGDDDE